MSKTKVIKQQKKKQQKETKRRNRKAKDAVWQAKVQRRSRFPKFEVGLTGLAEPEFVDAVYAAAKKVDFYDRNNFKEFERFIWKGFAQFGEGVMENARRAISCNLAEHQHQSGDILSRRVMGQISQAVYSLIPDQVKEQFMPLNYFCVIMNDRKLALCFDRLNTIQTAGGPIHCPKRPVTVHAAGEERALAFTTHAIKRACERIAPNWRHCYLSLLDIVRFCEYIPAFEMVTLRPNQQGILLYASCGPNYTLRHSIYLEEILGQEKLDPNQGSLEYRLGYCPLKLQGPYAIARTFLPPGYSATPEYGVLMKNVPPGGIRPKLMEMARNHVPDLERTEDWVPLIKWLHDNGVPQVRQSASKSPIDLPQ